MGTYVSMSWTMAVALLVMTLVVVLVVTGLTVSGALTRERTRLGVLKAIGFTSGQLRWSLMAAHLPPVVAGATVGAVVGGLTMNGVLSLMLASTGIHRLESTMPVLPAIGLSALVIGVAAGLIAAMSRTRRIDVTALAGE